MNIELYDNKGIIYNRYTLIIDDYVYYLNERDSINISFIEKTKDAYLFHYDKKINIKNTSESVKIKILDILNTWHFH